ncbi:MAG TPA: class I SAM-dependent methyltransferase [Phycisphaerales bacterium]|nr:class I SAM-dependent methyltransferase [Phycisphaerales bacterium]
MNPAPPVPPLHTLRPTTRFSERAADYARARPSYPREAIDAVLAGLGDPRSLAAVDVGAGTGISARLLADRGVRVVAVEPNAAMRDAAEPHPLVTWADATAERTGLPARSADLVLCAQAFHWFRAGEALGEFHRLLRPGGRLALVWNDKDLADPFTAAYTRAILEAAEDPAAEKHLQVEALRTSPLFTGLTERAFPYRQPLTRDGIAARALSASYVPRSGPRLDRLLEALAEAHARFAGPDGLVSLAYRTLVYLAAPTGPDSGTDR